MNNSSFTFTLITTQLGQSRVCESEKVEIKISGSIYMVTIQKKSQSSKIKPYNYICGDLGSIAFDRNSNEGTKDII